MANTLEILLIAKDQFTAPMQKYGVALGMLSKQADDAAAKVEAAGKKASGFSVAAQKIDSAGRNARIGLSSAAQAADLFGGNLSSVIGPAAGAADALGDIVGMLGAMGAALGIVSAVGLAIGFIVSQLNAINEANTKRVAEIAKPFQQVESSLKELGRTDPLAQLAQSIGVSTERMKEFAASSENARESLLRLNEIQKQIAETTSQLAHVQDVYARTTTGREALFKSDLPALIRADIEAMQLGISSAEGFKNKINELNEANLEAGRAAAYAAAQVGAEAQALADAALKADYAAAAAKRYADAIGDTRREAVEGRRADTRSISEMHTAQWMANNEFKEGIGWVEKIDKTMQKAATGGVNAYSQAMQKLKGLIESALSPTSVEKRLGMVGDAWDEFRLRLEAVATGTDPSQYGEAFVKQMTALGMSAEQAAAAFKDFSLFADPKNINLVNWAPLVADVQHQLDMMIGKANLTSAAMKEVWKNLSPQQKAVLAEQGIDSATEAVQALIDPTSQAKVQVQGLGSALSAIPTAITTTFNIVKDAAEAAIQEFQEVLDEFIAKYGNVTINISAETSATPPTAAPPVPGSETSTMPGAKFAAGGSFVVPRGFPNDSFPMRVSSGEHVQVTPASQTRGAGGDIYISIDGSPFQKVKDRRVRMRAMLGAI